MSETTRGEVVRVGVDLTQRVIQAHGVDAAGRVRTTGAKQFEALGHTARLVAPKFITPHRMSDQRDQNDAADAKAGHGPLPRSNEFDRRVTAGVDDNRFGPARGVTV